jgi:molybdopterin synthase sulfur carrier subunit
LITIRYFARLREALGRESERIELPAGVTDLSALRTFLCARGDAWARELSTERRVLAAVRQEMAGPETPVEDGDEVAFFPPVTGGAR